MQHIFPMRFSGGNQHAKRAASPKTEATASASGTAANMSNASADNPLELARITAEKLLKDAKITEVEHQQIYKGLAWAHDAFLKRTQAALAWKNKSINLEEKHKELQKQHSQLVRKHDETVEDMLDAEEELKQANATLQETKEKLALYQHGKLRPPRDHSQLRNVALCNNTAKNGFPVPQPLPKSRSSTQTSR